MSGQTHTPKPDCALIKAPLTRFIVFLSVVGCGSKVPEQSTTATTGTSATTQTSTATSATQTSTVTTTATATTRPTVPVFVPADDPGFHYVGRLSSGAASFHWPGTRVEANFMGTSLSLVLDDETGENYLHVTIDGGDPEILDLDPGEAIYPIAANLVDQSHSVILSKRTESGEGDLHFKGLILDPGAYLAAAPSEPSLRMEFYGDSITSGYSVDCACDDGSAEYKNHDETYAALSARTLEAEHHSLSLSGLGIVKSWWNATVWDYYDGVTTEDHDWDFNVWPADIIVINLGQNDKWLGVGEEIREAYVMFVLALRSHHPAAEIFLALGSMDAVAPGSPFPGYLEGAVSDLNNTYSDSQVHAVLFPYNGSGAHPVASEQAEMADVLVEAISTVRPDLVP